MINQLLLLIDIQNDYFQGGKMELYQMEAAADKASQLLSLFRKKNWPIVHVQHLSVRPNATFFIPGTKGVEIHSSVYPLKDETIVQKNFPNSFRLTNLEEILLSQKISHLVICGAMSHMCIDTTTRAACDLGYQITLIHDACATRNLIFNEEVVEASKVQTAYMAALNGSFARVASTSEYLMEMGQQ
jgi:nicotinamidase-related amidase